jgi:acid phosphatase family membrane protein YuiD
MLFKMFTRKLVEFRVTVKASVGSLMLSSIIAIFVQSLDWVLVKVRAAGGMSSPKSAAVSELSHTMTNQLVS